ncbi:inner-membrane translocator [marine sediment metagenome]|uniref:Inner-membrane translocator n=1 Tax=marine sediment metagenome TaxID=412755 RepID=A0A1B6NT71_9ZZZZ
MLATFGLVMVVTELVKIIWGQSPLSILPPDVLSGSVPLVGALRYPVFRLVVIAAGLAVAVGLWLVITRTRIGMRCGRAPATARWWARLASISGGCSR